MGHIHIKHNSHAAGIIFDVEYIVLKNIKNKRAAGIFVEWLHNIQGTMKRIGADTTQTKSDSRKSQNHKLWNSFLL